MDQPALQAVRDACADLARSDHEANDMEEELEDEEPFDPRKFKSLTDYLAQKDVRMFDRHRRGDIPRHWQSKSEQARKKRFKKAFHDEESSLTDLDVMDEAVFTRKKVRVKLCGHWIWNYASNVDMTRSGWLIFSIMTNCGLFKATELCRSWNELFELSVLTVFNYFPSSFKARRETDSSSSS